MSAASPFMPAKGKNQKVSATTTSAAITIGGGNKSVRVINAGVNVTYFRTYLASDGAQACTAADTPMAVSGAAGSVLVIEKTQDHDTISYLAETGATVMHFQPGEGGC